MRLFLWADVRGMLSFGGEDMGDGMRGLLAN
jgi:hypothetical protein